MPIIFIFENMQSQSDLSALLRYLKRLYEFSQNAQFKPVRNIKKGSLTSVSGILSVGINCGILFKIKACIVCLIQCIKQRRVRIFYHGGQPMTFDIISGIVSSIAFLTALIFLGIKLKQKDEPFYPAKIFLYYFISAFKLILFLIPIPIGLFICLFHLAHKREITNRHAKKAAIVLGIVSFLFGCMAPLVRTEFLTSARTIQVKSWNIKIFHFRQEYNEIITSLGSDGLTSTPTVNSFRVMLDKNDNILQLSFNLNYSGDTYRNVDVDVESGNPDTHTLDIQPTLKSQSNSQILSIYGTIQNVPNTNAKKFFSMLDALPLDKMKYANADENTFSLESSLVYSSGQSKNAEVYIIDKNSFHKIKDKGQTGNILSCGGEFSDDQQVKFKNYLLSY